MVKAHKVKLNNGRDMPMVGLGTYSRNAEPGQYRKAVELAIEAGYRHIDTASCYKNEEEVGEGIANKIKEGVVTRDELFVTTKLWNDKHAEKDVVPALRESLQRLKLDYVDLYLIHWPVCTNDKGEDAPIEHTVTWRAMEECVKIGLTKSIGVSNFNESQLENLLKNCTIKPAVNQFEISLTLTQHNLVDFCQKQSVLAVAYTPLGLLSDARPEFAGKDEVKRNDKLKAIAERHGKSVAQVALKYLIQRGIPVIPKSFTKSRIEENLNIFDFELSKEEMSIVDACNVPQRCVPGLSLAKLTYFSFDDVVCQ